MEGMGRGRERVTSAETVTGTSMLGRAGLRLILLLLSTIVATVQSFLLPQAGIARKCASSALRRGKCSAYHFGKWQLQFAPVRGRQVRHRAAFSPGGASRLSAQLAELAEVGGCALTHHYITVADKVTLHVVEAGNPGGTAGTVCLLHGFPDFWLSWRRQLPPLVQAGYKIICPDMRGYGKSSKPEGIERYSEVEITADVDALRKYFCGEEGTFELLVGHDWGAAAAWGTMSCYPRLAKKLAILNVPHPRVFADGLSTPQQLLKSWYVFAFQLPLISELGFSALNGQLVRYVFTNDPDTPLKAWELDRYVEAATGHGGMTGAINWYRAAGAGLWPANMPSLPPPFVDLIQTVQGVKGKSRLPANAVRSDVIECPVLVLWGERDRYLGRELATPPREAVPKCRLHYLDATHWVHWDQPGQVTDYLLEFLRE